MDTPSARVTQRAPQSCQRCSSKKMRCSKTVPCETCVGQGLAAQCRRETVITTKHIRGAQKHRRHKVHRSDGANSRLSTPPLDPSEPYSARPSVFDEDGTSTHPSPDHEATAAMLVNFAHQPSDLGCYTPRGYDSTAYGAAGGSTTRTQSSTGLPDGGQGWSGLPELETPPSSTQDEASPFETTISSLECLVWGRQRDGGAPSARTTVPLGNIREDGPLTQQQAVEILNFHSKWLTWTHNLIHWPTFREECQEYWDEGLLKEKAWLALYYAVLCVGLHHMTPEQRSEIGLVQEPDVAAMLYKKCVNALKDSDYAAVHSFANVQAICLLVLCAHDFNGSNLLSVLLSSAIRIAQALNIHRLGPDPVPPVAHQITLAREVRKSVWLFLSVQDWFLTPFNNAHSIAPNYCTTPLPTHCDDIAGATDDTMSTFQPLPMQEPTLMSYQLLMYEVAKVFRSFYDQTTGLAAEADQDVALRKLYDHVLDADSKMQAITRSLPHYFRFDYRDPSRQLPCYIPRQRYHLAISIAHKTLAIHGRFFLRSLTDRWFHYTKVTCVNCARTILTRFRTNSDESTSRNLWTVLAHVISAAVILALEMIFSGPAAHAPPPSSANDADADADAKRRLITDCVALLRQRASPSPPSSSSMSTRGVDLIELLLDHAADTTRATGGATGPGADGGARGAARGSPPDLPPSAAGSGVRGRGGRGIDLQAIARHLAGSRRTAVAGNGAAAAAAAVATAVPSFAERGGVAAAAAAAAADAGLPDMNGLDFDLGGLEAWVQHDLDIPSLLY